jgi:hypothetical protein
MNILLIVLLFNYDNYKELKIDLNFLLYNLYTNINITNLQQKEQRLEQNSFRKELIKKYNKCLISHSIDIECEACHIIPYYKHIYNTLFYM